MTLYALIPLWFFYALLGTVGVLLALAVHQHRARLIEAGRSLVAKNDALWTGPWRPLLLPAVLLLLVNLVPLALSVFFGACGVAYADRVWTPEQIRWAGGLVPAYELSRTLILSEYLGTAGLLLGSGVLRLISRIIRKMRS